MSYVDNRRFYGNRHIAVSAIAGAITLSRSAGELPAFVQVSASGITATGTSRPFEHMEFRVDFGDPTSEEWFTDPHTGKTCNSNIQTRPGAAHCYRTAGVKTITLRVRGRTAGGAFITEEFTAEFTATAFPATGGEYWFDSVAGDDGNDGLSSGAPKQSIAALNALIDDDTAFNLKSDSDWSGTVGIALPSAPVDGLRIRAYGTGAKPIINVTSGTARALSGNNGSASVPRSKTNMVFSDLDLRQTAGAGAVSLTATSNTTGVMEDIYLDNCPMTTTSGLGMTTCVISFNKLYPDTMSRVGLWNCDLAATEISGLGTKHGFFGGPHEWFFCYGGSIKGGGSNTTLDHHMYMEVRNQAVYAWIAFGNGPGRNYCLNINIHYTGAEAAPTVVYGDYHCVSDCKLSGTRRGCDASETHLDIDECRFRNFVIEGGCATGLSADGVIFFYSAETITVRRVKSWGAEGGRWFSPAEATGRVGLAISTILQSAVYDCDVYFSAAAATVRRIINYEADFTEGQQVTDNRITDLRADARAMRTGFAAAVTAGDLIDFNTFYVPNDSTHFFDGSTAKTRAEWTALFDAGGSGADPGWVDPATGEFDLPAGRVRFGLLAA
jgi:hypothetical protein